MNTKTKHQKNKYPETFPFTKLQMKKFKREFDQAGGFHQLMIQKEALEIKNGMKYIRKNYNVEGYRRKYLIGAYKPLREMYDTDIPFIFWSDLYNTHLKINGMEE